MGLILKGNRFVMEAVEIYARYLGYARVQEIHAPAYLVPDKNKEH